jgi:hypothetical protein
MHAVMVVVPACKAPRWSGRKAEPGTSRRCEPRKPHEPRERRSIWPSWRLEGLAGPSNTGSCGQGELGQRDCRSRCAVSVTFHVEVRSPRSPRVALAPSARPRRRSYRTLTYFHYGRQRHATGADSKILLTDALGSSSKARTERAPAALRRQRMGSALMTTAAAVNHRC